MAYALTTVDNPFNPLKEFEEWYNYDTSVLHYNSCAYLDRMVTQLGYDPNDFTTDEEYNEIVKKAIGRIIAIDPLNIYQLVSE